MYGKRQIDLLTEKKVAGVQQLSASQGCSRFSVRGIVDGGVERAALLSAVAKLIMIGQSRYVVVWSLGITTGTLRVCATAVSH